MAKNLNEYQARNFMSSVPRHANVYYPREGNTMERVDSEMRGQMWDALDRMQPLEPQSVYYGPSQFGPSLSYANGYDDFADKYYASHTGDIGEAYLTDEDANYIHENAYNDGFLSGAGAGATAMYGANKISPKLYEAFQRYMPNLNNGVSMFNDIYKQEYKGSPNALRNFVGDWHPEMRAFAKNYLTNNVPTGAKMMANAAAPYGAMMAYPAAAAYSGYDSYNKYKNGRMAELEDEVMSRPRD